MPVIDAVLAALHVLDGEVNWTQPTRFEVLFAGLPTLRISAKGGDHVKFDRIAMEPFDIKEHGRIEIFDFTDQLSATLRRREIGPPHLIHDGSINPIGLAFRVTTGSALCLWIANDEWHWGSIDQLNACTFGEAITPVVTTKPIIW